MSGPGNPDPGYCHRCNIHEAEVCGYCEGTNPERPLKGAPDAVTDADGFCVVCESGGDGCDACRPARPLPRPEQSTGGACFVCAREALAGLTYKNKPVCLHCAPHSLTGEVMLQFTDTEAEAITAGGAEAGAYLEAIGKFDLSELTPEQWAKFLSTFLHGYSGAMREAARTNPPF